MLFVSQCVPNFQKFTGFSKVVYFRLGIAWNFGLGNTTTLVILKMR